jgi:prepilin-type processing-associated H-X9-DG protein
MAMGIRVARGAFSLLEVAVSIALVTLLLTLLVPLLSSARLDSYREHCAANQAKLGEAWDLYLTEHNEQFPVIRTVGAQWEYGGALVASIRNRNTPTIDLDKPLSRYVAALEGMPQAPSVFHCPADRGIRGETASVGTGDRAVFEAFGTSYRANSMLFDRRLCGMDDSVEPVSRGQITTSPSRLLVLGCPLWYEQREATGRQADWFGDGMSNLLFLDGSVRYRALRPRPRVGPVVVNPFINGVRIDAPPAGDT